MLIEIWSDVICPFCYIGKRKFEMALSRFPYKDQVQIKWKSFQLDPTLGKKSIPIVEYLAETKGMHEDQVKMMQHRVGQTAQEIGLELNFEKTLAVNTFDAHRLIHWALRNQLQNEAEEALFQAHFTDGKNISDPDILMEVGKKIGLETDGVKEVLQSGAFSEAVKSDMIEAQKIGIRGVPYFIFNRKYTISGAQEPEMFSKAMVKVYEEGMPLNDTHSGACSRDGKC